MSTKTVFFMGIPAGGRTYWSEKLFPDYTHLTMHSYQQQAGREYTEIYGSGKGFPYPVYMEMLRKANERLLAGSLAVIGKGEPLAIEGTFYKAKRRVAFVDAIRALTQEPIDVYLVSPGLERLTENMKARGMTDKPELRWRQREEIEFPNRDEGFARIFEIRDGQIVESNAQAQPGLADRARAELAEEERERQATKEKQAREAELYRKLKESELPFLHVCEVCGKRETLTAAEAFRAGWDYPPRMGGFGLIGPRTCGECQMKDTVWWAMRMTTGT